MAIKYSEKILPRHLVRLVHRSLSFVVFNTSGEWRKLHNEELNDLYSLPNIVAGGKIEKNEMGRICGAYGGG